MFTKRLVACLLFAVLPGWAQAPAGGNSGETAAPGNASQPNIQVQVNVVNVPVTVTDANNRFITDLEKKDFTVWEDGKQVEVRYFSRDPKMPVVVGFLLDISNSARLYFKTYQEAITDLAFVLLPGDNQNRGFLGAYSTQADFLVKPTSDGQLIADKMRSLKPGGGSAMLDAIYTACTKYFSVKGQPNEPKRVLIIVGDGHDNNSKVSLDQVLEAAQRAQVVIYAVSTVGYGFTNDEEQNLVRLTEETGGRIERPLQGLHKDVSGYLSTPSDEGNYAYKVGTGGYAAELSGKLYQAITNLAGDIEHQYILGYTPPTPFTDRKFRSVKVTVNLKGADIKIRARKGYFPP
jgi:Ca-activated chloride channel family protein